jgi:NADPH:quinone reductase-like Zn-dependent oxidoreductase
VPPPDDGYVQVRVEAAGLNFRDVLNVLGLYPGDPGPIGGDFAGIVTQLGTGVTGLEVGQRVYGFMQGAFASRFNVPVQLLAPLPDGLGCGSGGHHSRCGTHGPARIRLGAAEAR